MRNIQGPLILLFGLVFISSCISFQTLSDAGIDVRVTEGSSQYGTQDPFWLKLEPLSLGKAVRSEETGWPLSLHLVRNQAYYTYSERRLDESQSTAWLWGLLYQSYDDTQKADVECDDSPSPTVAKVREGTGRLSKARRLHFLLASMAYADCDEVRYDTHGDTGWQKTTTGFLFDLYTDENLYKSEKTENEQRVKLGYGLLGWYARAHGAFDLYLLFVRIPLKEGG